MHVTFLLGLIVLASYDEYTALVNNDGASKHVWKAVNYVTFLLDMWLVLC